MIEIERPSHRVAGMVLAAGASTRLGSPKQLLLDDAGDPLVVRSAKQLLAAGCAPVYVVIGAAGDAVEHALASLPVTVCVNNDWAEGIGSSIRCGVESLLASPQAPSTDALVIVTCDMPAVTTDHLSALRSAWDASEQRVASSYRNAAGENVHGIPAIFPKADWSVLRALSGDRGARDLIRSNETLSVFLRLGNFDLDTADDVRRWRSQSPLHPPKSIPMSQIVQSALADLEHEFAQTRKMLSRVPADHLSFTPHEKSWPLQRLANHLTDFPFWGETTLRTDALDFADPTPPSPPVPTTAEGFVAQFDERMVRFRNALAEATDEQMMEIWTLKNAGVTLMAMPRVAVLRSMVISHMIHHRAQLTIYFRLVGVSVPGLYGPSADEAM